MKLRYIVIVILLLLNGCSSYRQLAPNEYLNNDYERDGIILIMKDSTVHAGSNISIGFDTTSFIEKKSGNEVKVLTKDIVTYKTVDRWGGALKGVLYAGTVSGALLYSYIEFEGRSRGAFYFFPPICLGGMAIGFVWGFLTGSEYIYELNHDSTTIAK